ncbi:glutathione S-transferase N-terminal domain-containing protein [Pseudosulfitobacter sp. SM2401]|uniref:glutathione S-transferase family protein n=1 Tax=Pseudosulfitobacter sp. SM2401 TaxID=3350098 RepID=UPI0036F1A28F
MITLHHCPQTRSMRSLWLLHELGVEFDVVTHAFGKNLRDPDYLNRSFAGRVPALELDGQSIFETGAITEVLCERFSPDTLGRPAGHPERADWLVWVHFAETISQHTAALTQQHVALREDHMRSPIVMKLEAARIGKCFAAIEARLTALGTPAQYLLEGGFSAADISVGQAVYMARFFATLDGFPKAAAWYERLTARDAFQASLPDADQRLFPQAFFAPWPME